MTLRAQDKEVATSPKKEPCWIFSFFFLFILIYIYEVSEEKDAHE